MKTTLQTSGEDVKTTLETSGEDVKTTLGTSGEDVLFSGSANNDPDKAGVVPRVILELFRRIDKERGKNTLVSSVVRNLPHPFRV